VLCCVFGWLWYRSGFVQCTPAFHVCVAAINASASVWLLQLTLWPLATYCVSHCKPCVSSYAMKARSLAAHIVRLSIQCQCESDGASCNATDVTDGLTAAACNPSPDRPPKQSGPCVRSAAYGVPLHQASYALPDPTTANTALLYRYGGLPAR
jgi:hypothetical protein